MFWKYVRGVLIGLDQFANAIAGGDVDETISSRLGKIKRAHGGRLPFWRHPLVWVIDWGLEKVDPGHSIDSIDETTGDDAVIKHRHET